MLSAECWGCKLDACAGCWLSRFHAQAPGPRPQAPGPKPSTQHSALSTQHATRNTQHPATTLGLFSSVSSPAVRSCGPTSTPGVPIPTEHGPLPPDAQGRATAMIAWASGSLGQPPSPVSLCRRPTTRTSCPDGGNLLSVPGQAVHRPASCPCLVLTLPWNELAQVQLCLGKAFWNVDRDPFSHLGDNGVTERSNLRTRGESDAQCAVIAKSVQLRVPDWDEVTVSIRPLTKMLASRSRTA